VCAQRSEQQNRERSSQRPETKHLSPSHNQLLESKVPIKLIATVTQVKQCTKKRLKAVGDVLYERLAKWRLGEI
jgi:hypothetical protein